MQQLYPEPGPVDQDALIDLYAPPPRPSLRVNFVASLDGAGTLDGKSAGLSGPEDKRVFGILRMHCDALLVGAGTVREEGYRALRLDAERRQWRLANGMSEFPTLVIVSGRCDLDPAQPALADAPVRPVIVTVAGAEPGALQDVADVIRAGDERVDLRRGGRAAAGARVRAAPQRGRADAVRVTHRGGPRRRAVPHGVAIARRAGSGQDHRRTGTPRHSGESHAASRPAGRWSAAAAIRPLSTNPHRCPQACGQVSPTCGQPPGLPGFAGVNERERVHSGRGDSIHWRSWGTMHRRTHVLGVDHMDANKDGPIVGRVLGTGDATPLTFWVAVHEDAYLQLDDVVVTERELPGQRRGEDRRRGHRRSGPGTRGSRSTPTCSSSPTACCRRRCRRPPRSPPPGSSPRSTSRRTPGAVVQRAQGDARDQRAVLRPDGAHDSRSGSGGTAQPLFLNARLPRRQPRRARVNISGISGVATKTTLRDVPALLGVPARGAGGAGETANTQRADLQRQGRGPALPRPPQRPARRRDARPATRGSAWSPGRSPTCGVYAPPRAGDSDRHAGRRSRADRGRQLLLDARRSSAPTGCCRSCSPTPKTSASSTRWWSTT